MKESEKRWRGHSSFQQELAEYVSYAVIATGKARVDAVANLVEFVLFGGMRHENKHCEGSKDGPTIGERKKRHTCVPDGRWAWDDEALRWAWDDEALKGVKIERGP